MWVVIVFQPGGSLFITTINKTNLSYVFGIVAAEQLLRIVPSGTHDWEKFISPEDLERLLESCECHLWLPFLSHYHSLISFWVLPFHFSFMDLLCCFNNSLLEKPGIHFITAQYDLMFHCYSVYFTAAFVTSFPVVLFHFVPVGFHVDSIRGMMYNPLTGAWSWQQSTAINYALHAVKRKEEPQPDRVWAESENLNEPGQAKSYSWAIFNVGNAIKHSLPAPE